LGNEALKSPGKWVNGDKGAVNGDKGPATGDKQLLNGNNRSVNCDNLRLNDENFFLKKSSSIFCVKVDSLHKKQSFERVGDKVVQVGVNSGKVGDKVGQVGVNGGRVGDNRKMRPDR